MPKYQRSRRPWLPAAGLAVLLVAGLLVLSSLPGVAPWLRVPCYRAWNALHGPGMPPARVVMVTVNGQESLESPSQITVLLAKVLTYGPVAIALDGTLLGMAGDTAREIPAPSDWLPSKKTRTPIVVGYPWSDVHFPRTWEADVTAGYLETASSQPQIAFSLLHLAPEGVSPSLGSEVLRRAIRLPWSPMPMVAGVGYLLGKNLIIPASPDGKAALRFYAPGLLPSLSAANLLSGDVLEGDIRGKVVFLVDTHHATMTYSGSRPVGEIAAVQASNLLVRHIPVTPDAGKTLAVVAGLIFALLAAMGILWFGKVAGGVMALGLALVYPGLSLVFFLAGNWWLPPEFPLLAVAASALPFLCWPQLKVRQQKRSREHKSQTPISLASPGTEPTKPQALSPNALNPALASPPTQAAPSEVERDATQQLTRIGKYKIIRKMGHGSAGEVYEAIDLQMGRRVAVKTMLATAKLTFDRAFERFLVEARAAGSLNHPNINTIHDFGTADGISFMVMEYLDGMTLAQWMKSHPTPTYAIVAPWIEQIASALDYAHAHKVIHRDLKPSNLMVVTEGNGIKLLDFGVAKFGDVMLTQTGMTVGTPTYMSPEQLQGLKVGPGSDQYTLGVLVYQLLTYRFPYAGQKIPEICNRILKGETTPIRDYKPELPEAFWEALQRSFSRQPDARHPSCLAFFHALDAAMTGPPVVAVTPPMENANQA